MTAALLNKLAAFYHTLGTMIHLYQMYDKKITTNNETYTELTNGEKLVVYNLQNLKRPRELEPQSCSFVGALEITQLSRPVRAMRKLH